VDSGDLAHWEDHDGPEDGLRPSPRPSGGLAADLGRRPPDGIHSHSGRRWRLAQSPRPLGDGRAHAGRRSRGRGRAGEGHGMRMRIAIAILLAAAFAVAAFGAACYAIPRRPETACVETSD